MSKKASIFTLFLIAGYTSLAQTSLEKTALGRIEKKKWQKAEQSLKKSIRKDSLNATARYVFALWYYDTTNPRNNIDSSYAYVQKALEDYQNSDDRLREKTSRFPLDSAILIQLRQRIEGSAFERAKQVNTEEGYRDYIERYNLAKEKESAIELRDEVAFLEALKSNTYVSFKQYFTKYPNSHRAEEARSRYEKLLYEDKTRDGKLKNYKEFYKAYPSSPFRPEALEKVFEIETASGALRDFHQFMRSYSSGALAKRALDFTYHISLTLQEELHQQLGDSLQTVAKLNEGYLVPILTGDRYGFMNENGFEVLPTVYKDISERYLCGNIEEDYLIVDKKVINREGKVIAGVSGEEIDDLGFGYLLIKGSDCNRLVHKSGFKAFEDCVTDAKVVANSFLATRDSKGWGLFAFNGRRLTPNQYEDVSAVDDIIVFAKGGKKTINTLEEVAAAADQVVLPETRVFDEIKKLNSQFFLVRNGALQGVFNSKLEFVIPLNRQVLSLASFGFVRKVNEKVTTIGISETLDKDEFMDIVPYGDWLALYKSADTILYHQPSNKIIARDLDSLWFSNKLAMSKKKDSITVYFNSGRKASFLRSNPIHFIKSPDSVRHFYTADRNRKDVFEVDSGNRLFKLEFESIEYLGQDLFLVTNNGKKGIANRLGETVLKNEYDAIVRTGENVLSLLKEKRFGLFYMRSRRLIEAKFERNLTFYSDGVLVAFKDGNYGFIGEDANPISDFRFEEVRPWSDSLAMVKMNFNWLVYDIYSTQFIMSGLKDYRLIKNDPLERLAIIYKDNKYGVLSSTRGTIIPPTFTEIINLGTAEKPLYFTEKNVEEAEVFIVIYYDQNGVMRRRAIYEIEEYDNIYCQ